MKSIESIISRTIRFLVLPVVLLTVSLVAIAQEGGPAYINVRIVTVKADRIAQWESLQKEATEAMAENGVGFRHIFQRMSGSLDTYVIITPEALVEIPVTENWLAAISGTIVSRSSIRLQVYPDLFTLEEGGNAVPTRYLHTRLRTSAPGRRDDYHEWQRDELIPALREAGVGDVRTLRIALGGNLDTWVRFSFVDDMPGTGGNPVAESMGQQAMQRMIGRGADMVSQSSDYFDLFRSDLSFDAP